MQTYLKERLSSSTVKLYLRDIAIYISHEGEEKAIHASWPQVMTYIDNLRGHYTNACTINRILYAIKAYYNFLIDTGERDDHPCRGIKLRDAKNTDLQLQDLFTSQELETLLDRQERYGLAGIKNQVMMSLLIYQGITAQEMTNIATHDINLQKGSIRIKPTRKLNGRTLPLQPSQIMLFYNYLNQVRPQLLKKRKSESFIVTLRGSAETGEGIGYLAETLRDKFPERKLNPQTIRMSVISNMLKAGHGLRTVQVFAGHKKISSTERYRPTASEALKTAVLKFHPLG